MRIHYKAKTLLATLENVVVEAESKHGAVVWSSAQNDPPTIPTDSFPLQLIVLTGNEIQRHLPETLHVEATGLGGRDLSYPIGISRSDRIKKGSRSTDLHLLLWKKRLRFLVPLEAPKPLH